MWGVRMMGEAMEEEGEEEEEEEEGGDAKALESWREPWVGNDPESSRSTAAGRSDMEAECRASQNMEYW